MNPAEANDLVITRVLKAPRAALWRAWSEPALLKAWWCPRPWSTEVRAFDLGPGGAFHTFMTGPASRDRHEQMGFFDGWNTCITQLEDFAAALPRT